MLKRALEPSLRLAATEYPIVALLGPRQSGKTTLVRYVFAQHHYLSLEDLDTREHARRDPRDFLEINRNPHGLIIDEAQHVPELFSYLQTTVDQDKRRGYFILTGSQNFSMNAAITQSLAGRIAILTLLPLSIAELKTNGVLPTQIEVLMFQGLYPSIYATDQLPQPRPAQWYTNYIRSYIEKDVRQIKNITNLSDFQRFMQLCAARTGQILNLSTISIECGVTVSTAKAWLAILEASYIIYLLQPHSSGFKKRLVKAPKLFFFDSGIVCALLKLNTLEKVTLESTIKGNIFESIIITELAKAYYNQDRPPQLYFWRDKTGHEVDCVIDQGTHLVPVEIKFTKTFKAELLQGLNYWNQLAATDPQRSFLIYGGIQRQTRSQINILGWSNTAELVTPD
ncbi:MAG TPA: ATP-binding protein [Candidatus Babeliales bacterium]|nr:ATP-binding protein [Candidatus Babeliales bacterium]